MKVDELIKAYREFYEERRRLDAAYKAKRAALDEAMQAVKAKLLEHMNEEGVESVRTPEGTAYMTTKYSVRAADKDAFLQHVIAHESWHLLDVRPSKTAIQAMVEETGELPPGVDFTSVRDVNIRKS